MRKDLGMHGRIAAWVARISLFVLCTTVLSAGTSPRFLFETDEVQSDSEVLHAGPPTDCTGLTDGALCDDGDACTHDDACLAEECVGVDNVCTNGQQCDAATGDCACPDLCGDLDFDGDVDMNDRALFSDSYNALPTDPDFNICADFTGDGQVTRSDLRGFWGCFVHYARAVSGD